MEWKAIVVLLILCCLAGLAFLPKRSDLTIRVRSGSVSISGKLAKGKQALISRFFTELAAGRKLRVYYNYPRGGKLSPASIWGELTEGERQQIRNFLHNEL